MILWYRLQTNEDAADNRKQEASVSASLEALPSNNITFTEFSLTSLAGGEIQARIFGSVAY